MNPFSLLFVGLAALGCAAQSVPEPSQAKAPEAEDGAASAVLSLRTETARERIRKRNLFHPARGVPSKVEGLQGAGLATPLPVLVGTLVTRHQRSAMLRWGSTEDAQLVEEGVEVEGYRIKTITEKRVQLVGLEKGELHWVELDQDRSPDEARGDEVDALLDLTNKKTLPVPPAPPAKPLPTGSKL